MNASLLTFRHGSLGLWTSRLLSSSAAAAAATATATATAAPSMTSNGKMEIMDLAEAKGKQSMSTSKTKANKEAKKWRANAESMWDHFSRIYGARWEASLCQALVKPSKMAALINYHASVGNNDSNVESHQLEPITWAPPILKAYTSNQLERLPSPTKDQISGLPNYYCMDPASLLPALALDLHNSQCNYPIVLDLCAAPGGKTVIINRLLSERGGALVSNEPNKIRRERLERVIAEHVVDKSNLSITSLDGVVFGSTKHDFSDLEGAIMDGKSSIAFTHVLCDVPCSAERHVLHQSSGGEWTGKHSRNTRRQVALLKAAWAVCREGGTIVYSTCSLSPQENDEIVKKVITQRTCKIRQLHFPIGEPTEYGWMVLPDHPTSVGMGPMYIAAMQKE